MTIIVAAKLTTGGVCIAADSLTVAGWEKLHADRSKLWVSDPYVFGAAGDVRAAQVVQHFTAWPKYRPDEDTDVEAFLVKSVVPAIFAGANDKGVVRNDSGQTRIGIELVMAWGDHLAVMWGNGCVHVPASGRIAAGSGYAEAVGYLGESGPWTPADVCEAARRASLTNLGVDGPIHYVTTIDKTVVRPEPPDPARLTERKQPKRRTA